MSRCCVMLAVLASLALSATASFSQDENTMNPIRRVVSMLQSMQAKIAAEAKSEEQLYDKYMCYCKNGAAALQESIAASDAKIPQVESAIAEAEASITQMKQEIKDHQQSRADAKDAMASATGLREKEAAQYAEESSELKTNIDTMTKAVAALEKGMAGGFLQTDAAQILKKLVNDSGDLSEFDREQVTSFLSGGSSSDSDEGYVPSSGSVVGILKEMKDTMSKSLADATAAENEAIANYEALIAAKTKEVEANTEAIEKKTVRVGNLGVEIAEMKNDLDDTGRALLEDKKFLADMDKDCASKTSEWEEIKATRAKELVAIAETIKILNDDDALELFKKTFPSPSLMQVSVASRKKQQQALEVVRSAAPKLRKADRPALDLIAVALTGKKVNFDKVVQLIDDLVATLETEQKDDDAKKETCEIQLDSTEDKKKALAHDISDLETAIDELTERLATTTDEIKTLGNDIVALDKQVTELSMTRKEENEDFTELISSNNAAKELLAMAKNRLNKFYNPKLYKAPPKKVLSREEQIVENFSFVQIHEHRNTKEAPPPPPEAFKAYARKGEESTGVISMIDMLAAALDKEITEAETNEKDAQKQYEDFMSDAAAKRADDSKALTDKESAKADQEADLQQAKEEKTSKGQELMATEETESSLHAECDWLISNFELRKSARAGEVESLKSAKAILSGADYSLAQTKSVQYLRGA